MGPVWMKKVYQVEASRGVFGAPDRLILPTEPAVIRAIAALNAPQGSPRTRKEVRLPIKHQIFANRIQLSKY